MSLTASLIFLFLTFYVSPVHGQCCFIYKKLSSFTEKLYFKTPDLQLKYCCLETKIHYEAFHFCFQVTCLV